ncbi:MAG: hypothetical protein ABG776_08290 [Cyanobacteria bacterium J06555_13]
MTAATSPSDDRLDRIEQKLDMLADTVSALSTEVERSNDKFDTYQQATQWVVQLAFTLIASATITVILSTVLNR